MFDIMFQSRVASFLSVSNNEESNIKEKTFKKDPFT